MRIVVRLPAVLVTGLCVLVAGCTGSSPEPGESSPPAASPGTASPDFDGDGAADLVAGIGEATGRVTIKYASGRTQDLRPADVQAPDSAGFGRAILARDLDGDGITDLVVGDPGQASGSPAVFLVPGSSGGLDPAKAHGVSGPSGLVRGWVADPATGGPAQLQVGHEGTGSSAPTSRPLWSCRNARSPSSANAGRGRIGCLGGAIAGLAAAAPSAVPAVASGVVPSGRSPSDAVTTLGR